MSSLQADASDWSSYPSAREFSFSDIIQGTSFDWYLPILHSVSRKRLTKSLPVPIWKTGICVTIGTLSNRSLFSTSECKNANVMEPGRLFNMSVGYCNWMSSTRWEPNVLEMITQWPGFVTYPIRGVLHPHQVTQVRQTSSTGAMVIIAMVVTKATGNFRRLACHSTIRSAGQAKGRIWPCFKAESASLQVFRGIFCPYSPFSFLAVSPLGWLIWSQLWETRWRRVWTETGRCWTGEAHR